MPGVTRDEARNRIADLVGDSVYQALGLKEALEDERRALEAQDIDALDFGDDRPVLMTEKDAVKCRGFASGRLWYLPVDAAFSAEDARRLLKVAGGDLLRSRQEVADDRGT